MNILRLSTEHGVEIIHHSMFAIIGDKSRVQIVNLQEETGLPTSPCTMVMDVDGRFRTESHSETSGRLDERFLLLLSTLKACIRMDDEFNILRLSSHIIQVPEKEDQEGLSEAKQDHTSLKNELNDGFHVGPSIQKCCTLDQGNDAVTLLDAILDKTLRSVVALLASREGAESTALAVRYSTLYVTAPSLNETDVMKCYNTLSMLEEQSRAYGTGVEGSLSGVIFKKIELNECIRDACGDPTESSLNGLLCHDFDNCLPIPACHPLPSQCDLLYDANLEDRLKQQTTQLMHQMAHSSSPQSDSENHNNSNNHRGRSRDRGRNRGTKTAITLALLLLSFFGISAATILTIQSPDGDIIDCLNTMDQPSLKNPLLKNHVFQDYPSDMMKTHEEEEGFGWQVWHGNGTACPHGSIPIRRVKAELSHGICSPLIPSAADRATRGHQYAIAYVEDLSIYGTKATLNVWKPVVESEDDFSLAQIWVTSGSYENNDLNTLETGWQVYPDNYGDHQPRLFTYWTRDAYLTSGCYNDCCKGFVHVNRHVTLGGAIARTSTFGGDQLDITLQIWKDPVSGNWWLGMGLKVVPIGYWPIELFTTLSDHAFSVQWGGEVLYQNTSGLSNTTQMGSGEFPGKGLKKAAYFCNLQIAQKNRSFLPVQDFRLGATQPDSYTITKTHSRGCGVHFYYGGPGPQCSASVIQRDPLALILLLLAIYVVV